MYNKKPKPRDFTRLTQEDEDRMQDTSLGIPLAFLWKSV